MNNKHLNDFLEINEHNPEIKTGDLISEYTSVAIQFSNDGFRPSNKDYDLAYKVIIDKYRLKW